MYKMYDYDGKGIEGSFYVEELQKVKLTWDTKFQVESVLKEKFVLGKKKTIFCVMEKLA